MFDLDHETVMGITTSICVVTGVFLGVFYPPRWIKERTARLYDRLFAGLDRER